jgi:hypothetical protein
LALLEHLRRQLGPELGRLAYEQFDLQERARGKLPEPEKWWLTRRGLEQATHGQIAAARARHLSERLGAARGWLLDATCGLGAEALALCSAGLPTLAADRELDLARACAHNLQAFGFPGGRVLVADALAPPARPDWWLFDPDRRAGGPRSLDPEAWSPPLSAALERARAGRGAVFKLAPASAPEQLHSPGKQDHAWVWTSVDKELKELALYTGELAAGLGPGGQPGRREAWALRQGQLLRFSSLDAGPRELPAVEPKALGEVRALGEPDPALVRAGLLGALGRSLGLKALGPGIGWLAGEELDLRAAAPWLEGFRVLGNVPADRKAVRSLLAQHDIGPVQLQARGAGAPTEELAQRFAGPGQRRGILFVARTLAGRRALLVEPLAG